MNDGMGKYVASEVVKLMVQKDIKVKNSRILVLGITFKENCPDVRNTKAVDVIKNLDSYGIETKVLDTWAEPQEVLHEYGIKSYKKIEAGDLFDAIVLTVAHREFLELDLSKYLKENSVLYDVKGILTEGVTGRL